MILRWLQRWRQSRILRQQRIPESLWQDAVTGLPALQGLTHAELYRLRELASLLLHAKTFSASGGLVLTDSMRIQIAAQACLLILQRDLDDFDGWQEIIVYPDAFVVDREQADDSGVVHSSRHRLGGEAWGRGPLILSWQDVVRGNQAGASSNVILHEFAHKLDMLNGRANGMPPLAGEMAQPQWTAVWSEAYHDLTQALAHGRDTEIDPYAAENPAEFFAVLTETFFLRPQVLHASYPAVYQQLVQFYHQDPRQRLHHDASFIHCSLALP
jgi:Mlc titration factor MtfA (ptsG expression regulator)